MAHRTRLSAIGATSDGSGAIQSEKCGARPARAGDLARNLGEAAVGVPAVFVTRCRRGHLVFFSTPLSNELSPGFDSGPNSRLGRPSGLLKASGNATEFGACRGLKSAVGVFLHSVCKEGNQQLPPDSQRGGSPMNLLPSFEQPLPGQRAQFGDLT